MTEEMKKTNIFSILIALATIAIMAFVAFNWVDLQKAELKIEAIKGCAEAAAQAHSENGFNGAAYKICVEDQGYETKIK